MILCIIFSFWPVSYQYIIIIDIIVIINIIIIIIVVRIVEATSYIRIKFENFIRITRLLTMNKTRVASAVLMT